MSIFFIIWLLYLVWITNLTQRYMSGQREVEKREAFKRQGHGEYREVSEGDFLGEVTRTEKAICHFYHKEFYRCK